MSIQLVDSKGKLQNEKSLRAFIASLISSHTTTSSSFLPTNAWDAAYRTEALSVNESEINNTLQNVGTNYHVVGVFGGQSSGKSTLLNYLFHTNFAILDESIRRGQTTIGAFLSRALMCDDNSIVNTNTETAAAFVKHNTEKEATATTTEAAFQVLHSNNNNNDSNDKKKKNSSNNSCSSKSHTSSCVDPLLIVDFEGTDGLERGENQSFERQLSLFGLCMADTLIINMWAVDVGRFNAANLGLLRTIFEINLQLFSHDNYEVAEKPTLLVVIRDFLAETEAPSLATLKQSFETIWEGINRSGSKYEGAKIDDLFNFKFYFLPHYKLQQELFEARVNELQRWFCDSTCENYLFHHRKMFRNVPLDGLASYLTNCWEAIRASKDLDIPTQREMLARHRCEEIKRQEINTFNTRCKEMRSVLHAHIANIHDSDNNGVESPSHTLQLDARQCMSRFDAHTRLYSAEIVEVFRRELRSELYKTRMRFLSEFASNFTSTVTNALEGRLQAALDMCWAHVVKQGQCIPFTAAITSSSLLPQQLNSASETHQTLLSASPQNTLHATGSTTRSGIMPSTSPNTATTIITRYEINNNAIQEAVMQFYTELQHELCALLNDMKQSTHSPTLYGTFAAHVLDNDNLLRSLTHASVAKSLLERTRSKIVAMAEAACEVMHRGFESSLHHNSDGSVQFFTSTKSLAKATPGAQQVGLVLLSCLLYFRLVLHEDTYSCSSDELNECDVYNHSEGAIEIDLSAEKQKMSNVNTTTDDSDNDNNNNNDSITNKKMNSKKPEKSKANFITMTSEEQDERLIKKLESVSIQVRANNDEMKFFLTFTTLDVNPIYPTMWRASQSNKMGQEANMSTSVSCVLEMQQELSSIHSTNRHINDTVCTDDTFHESNDDHVSNTIKSNNYNRSNNKSLTVSGDKDMTCTLEHGICTSEILLSASAVQRAVEMYRQRCEFTLQLQMRGIESSRQRLPAWVIPALLILGWNELWYVLTSPVLLILVITIATVFFHGFIQTQWCAFQADGPAMIVIPLQSAIQYVQNFIQAINSNANNNISANINNNANTATFVNESNICNAPRSSGANDNNSANNATSSTMNYANLRSRHENAPSHYTEERHNSNEKGPRSRYVDPTLNTKLK